MAARRARAIHHCARACTATILSTPETLRARVECKFPSVKDARARARTHNNYLCLKDECEFVHARASARVHGKEHGARSMPPPLPQTTGRFPFGHARLRWPHFPALRWRSRHVRIIVNHCTCVHFACANISFCACAREGRGQRSEHTKTTRVRATKTHAHGQDTTQIRERKIQRAAH